ncbi:PQQ-binding-like beta-propeller repeat protein [Halomicroarcula sp. GCM10025324]|uniref:outer membrane protein assembly factor BamB family protein n=1 Tax=Halomicroarcula sp. GCM10025324 TaxID=3252667 RepID=UPI003607E42E
MFALGSLAIGSFVIDTGSGGEITVLWVSQTGREVNGNHHAPAVGQVGDGQFVYAPISGRADTDRCALYGLEASSGERQWRSGIAVPDCTLHSIADPAVADYDGDGTDEVLAATTEDTLTAYDPTDGSVEFEYVLDSYGYTKPLVANITGNSRPETVVVDVRGTVYVISAGGETVWTRDLESTTFAQPTVGEFDADDGAELAVAAGGAGELYLFEGDGTPRWDEPVTFDSSTTWMTTGQADADVASEIVVATALDGTVAMVDGNSTVLWERDLGTFAAVHGVTDGDNDGIEEVYAVAANGDLYSLDAESGQTGWRTRLTNADVQMMPPPAVGDVDGDGSPTLVAPANDGTVSLVDPTTGEVTATYEREVPIYTHPRMADIDDDGDAEALVMYGDGRVVALDFGRV